MPEFYDRHFLSKEISRERRFRFDPSAEMETERELHQRFLEAGFAPHEVPHFHELVMSKPDLCVALTPEVVTRLARIHASPKSRSMLINIFDYSYSDRIAIYLRSISGIENCSQDGEAESKRLEALSQISDFIVKQRDFDSVWTLEAHIFACIFYTDARLRALFERRPQSLSDFISKISRPSVFIRIVCVIEDLALFPDDEPVRDLSDSLDADFLSDHDNCRLIELVLKNRGFLPIVTQYLRSPRGWANSLQAADQCFRQVKLGGVTEAEINSVLLSLYVRQIADSDQSQASLKAEIEKVNSLGRAEKFSLLCQIRSAISTTDLINLKQRIIASSGSPETPSHANWLERHLRRASCRENIRHPLVSLGIAILAGYEIEYDKTAIPKEVIGDEFYDILSLMGIKRGLGDGLYNCDETSPGPFYDPETALAVFRLYCEAGVLDLYRFRGLTCHFNIDLPLERGLEFLIQSAYLSGAAYSPEFSYNDDRGNQSSVRIYPNASIFGRYFECKAFDIMSAPGFVWNYRSLTYLSWALAAYQEAEMKLGRQVGYRRIMASEMNPYKKKLAIIWVDYVRTIFRALKPLGLNKLMRDMHPTQLIRCLDRQISLVFPDDVSRYEDPNRKIEGALSVKLGPRKWPNIVSFAVDAIDESVSRVVEIETEVENAAVTAIKFIESASERQKPALIEQFIKDFNTLPGATPAQQLVAYQEVKALFADRL